MPEVLRIAGIAQLLFNISGHLTLEPILNQVRRKRTVTKIQDLRSSGPIRASKPFRSMATTSIHGWREHRDARCPIPTCGLRWLGQPRFVVLDQWPVCSDGDPTGSPPSAHGAGPSARLSTRAEHSASRCNEFRS
jgi:hypothetical protein